MMFKRFRRFIRARARAARAATARERRRASEWAIEELQHQEFLRQAQEEPAYRALERALIISGMQSDNPLELITLMNVLIDCGWRHEPPKGDRPPPPLEWYGVKQ